MAVNQSGGVFLPTEGATISGPWTFTNTVALGSGATLTNSIVSGAITDTSGVQRVVPNPTSKAIVDASATSLFDVSCPASASCGGFIVYHVFDTDGTDFQGLSGLVTYAAVNKAATLTLTITELATTQAKAVSSGTLTLAWTFVTGTNKGTVKLQPTGSLTETTFNVTYTVFPIKGNITVL